MEIVQFTSNDQEKTHEFMESIFKEKGWTPRIDDGLDNLAEFFHIPKNGFLLLAKENDAIIGTGGVTKINTQLGLIKRLYVGQNFRNQGIGKKILTSLVDLSRNFEISRLVLDVAKNNLPAIFLYEKRGFKRYNQNPIAGWQESNEPETHFFYFLDIINL